MPLINLEDYAARTDFPVADTGDYEVVLRVERKMTKDNSKEFVNLDFKIREDVDQPFQNTHVFDKAWRDASNPQWFDLKKLGKILLTQKGQEGYTNQFEEVDEFIQYINGVHMLVTIEKIYDDYSGKEVNQVKYGSYRPSVWDTQPHEAKAEAAADTIKKGNTEALEDVNIDDVPF